MFWAGGGYFSRERGERFNAEGTEIGAQRAQRIVCWDESVHEGGIEEGFITRTSCDGAEILTAFGMKWLLGGPLVQLTDWNGTLGIEAWGAQCAGLGLRYREPHRGWNGELSWILLFARIAPA